MLLRNYPIFQPADGLVRLQCLSGFFGTQDPVFSQTKIPKLESANTNPDELQDRMPNRFKHPANLPVLAFSDCQFKPRVFFRGANFTNYRGTARLTTAYID